MISKFYKQELKKEWVNGRLFYTRDYFQYYTSGVESVVPAYVNLFELVDRTESQRPENITYNLYGDADLADMILIFNNGNYLWQSPLSFEMYDIVVKLRMKYITRLMRVRVEQEPERDDEGKETGGIIYNKVGQNCLKKAEDQITEIDKRLHQVIVPKDDNIQDALRLIRFYFKNREVK